MQPLPYSYPFEELTINEQLNILVDVNDRANNKPLTIEIGRGKLTITTPYGENQRVYLVDCDVNNPNIVSKQLAKVYKTLLRDLEDHINQILSNWI